MQVGRCNAVMQISACSAVRSDQPVVHYLRFRDTLGQPDFLVPVAALPCASGAMSSDDECAGSFWIDVPVVQYLATSTMPMTA